MIVTVHIQGIPAQAEMTHYDPGHPGCSGTHCRRTGGLIDPGDPPEPEEIEYRILDRRGCPAPWLERKATDADEQRVMAAFREAGRRLDQY